MSVELLLVAFLVLAVAAMGTVAFARRGSSVPALILGGRVVRELGSLGTRSRGLATIELSALEVEIGGVRHVVLRTVTRAPLARGVSYVPLTPEARSRLGVLIGEMDAPRAAESG